MSKQLPLWERVSGNRQASRRLLLAVRGDVSGAHGDAIRKEGGEAQRSDERGVFA